MGLATESYAAILSGQVACPIVRIGDGGLQAVEIWDEKVRKS